MERIIPGYLWGPENLDQFLAWVRAIRLDPEDKKQLLMTWSDRFGVKISGDMVKRAGIE